MRKSVAKGSFFDDSYPRKSLYDEEPGCGPLKAAIKDMRTLSRCGMTERSHKGTTIVHGAVNGVLKPTPALGNKGITSLLPDFDGTSSRSFVLWLCEVKSCFMKQCLSDLEKCELVVSCLKGYALLWFKTLNVSRLTKGKSMIRSWHKLEPLMKKQYAPSCTLEKSKADLCALKQNILSDNKDAELCEVNHPMCDKNLEPKPETFEQTELEMACSPTEVNHVSDASIVRCLSPLKNDSMIVDHEEGDESPALTSSKPSKLSKKDLPLTHCENKDQFPNLSPNETISNHMLFECQTKKDNQPISHSITEIHGSLVKQGSRESPYFPLCPRVCHLASDLKPHPIFETCTVKGKSPDLSTPHFHFYMLVRLQDSLVHLSANPYILEGKNREVAQIKNCCPTLKILSYEECQSLECHYCTLFELEKGLSTSEMFVSRVSKWESSVNGEANQTNSCCPGLKFLCPEMNLGQMHCENLLEVLRISSRSSLHDLGGVLAFMGMFVLKLMNKTSSSPLMALCCSIGSSDPKHGLSLSTYMLLVSQCDKIVDKLGVEPPWPFGEEYMDSIERETRKGTSRGNKSEHASGLSVKLSIVVTELLTAASMSPRRSDLRESIFELEANLLLKRHFFLIFEPGGRKMKPAHGIMNALLIKQGVREKKKKILTIRI